MNDIFHTCSKSEDIDTCFRISEEQIFRDVFHYIEVHHIYTNFYIKFQPVHSSVLLHYMYAVVDFTVEF